MSRTLNIAHQGFASQYPSCTIPSFQAAIDLGADYIELDVHLSADEEVIVIHETTLEQTTNGKGLVRNHTLAQLKALDAGSWFHPKFAGERIPTFEEIIPLFKNQRTRMCIEIKSLGHNRYAGLEKKIIDALAKHDMLDKVAVTAYNGHALTIVREMVPNIPCAYDPNSEEYGYPDSRLLASVLRYNANILCLHHKRVTDALAWESKLRGIPMWVWTVNDRTELERLVGLGVEAIMTDYPDVLMDVIGYKKDGL
jgi:glycerophosphoryl diester phosphodiesterase